MVLPDSPAHSKMAKEPKVSKRFPNFRLGMIGAGVIAVMALSACAPGAQNSSTDSSSPISTNVPKDKITLSLAHWEVGGNADAIDKLIASYETLHPNVTIKTSFTSFNDYGQRIKLQMSSAEAPDIAEVGQAFTMMGPLVQGGLLRPMDDYSKLYGWSDRFGTGLLDQARFEADGSKFGTGNLYGLALGGNMVGVFYNKDVLKQLGVTPKFDDINAFQAALDTAKGAGVVPLELGNSEAWPANHLLSSLISQYSDKKELLDWIYGNKGASFTTPAFQKATDELSSWAKDGLIDSAANGLSNDDAINRFAAGNAAFFVTGNWSLATLSEKMGDKVGFIGFPPSKAGDKARATGATTSPFAISAKTKYPDVAANFIDFMTAPEQASILANGGYAPLSPGTKVIGSSALISEYNDVWSKVLADDGLTLYLDWSTVSMGNTLFPAIQELIAGKTSAADLTKNVQAEWMTAHS